jgi:hypothetical protein
LLWLFSLLLAFAFAKDNYVFDYRPDPELAARFEALDQEMYEIRDLIAALRSDQELLMLRLQSANDDKNDDKIKKLEAAVAKLTASVAKLATTAVSKPSAEQSGTKIVSTKYDDKIAELTARLEQINTAIAARVTALENKKVETVSATSSNDAQVETLTRRIVALENDIKSFAGRVKKDIVLPFDQYLEITKEHVEFFIIGLVAFVVLLFFMMLGAFGRAGRAESKIERLIKMYQSSSKNKDDRR